MHIRQTGRESLTVTAEDNLLPLIESRVAGGRLEAKVSGVGTVEYLGSPKVVQSVSGVGRVTAR